MLLPPPEINVSVFRMVGSRSINSSILENDENNADFTSIPKVLYGFREIPFCMVKTNKKVLLSG
jgi:hypothetical protein